MLKNKIKKLPLNKDKEYGMDKRMISSCFEIEEEKNDNLTESINNLSSEHV